MNSFMTVDKIVSELCAVWLNTADPTRELRGVYCGDLLSWVMGRLEEGNAWVTIMNNVNIIAVASLADASCVILAEDTEAGEDVIEKARSNSINLIKCKESSYEICCRLGKILNG